MLVRRCVTCVVLAMLFGFTGSATPAQETTGRPTFGEPSISPDHREIAFVSGGDIWSVPAAGGVARLLVAFDGTASRPLFSPDGTRIAFVSTRPGAVGIYVVTLLGGTLTRLTHDEIVPTLSAWSADGKFVYFSSPAHNIGYFADIMRVAVDGGTPMRVVGQPYAMAMDAAPSPDGSDVAYVRGGFGQWWRRGHSHIDEAAIVVDRVASGAQTQVTAGDSKDRWPMWSPDGASLYFISDRSGSDEVWERANGRLTRLTSLGGESTVWPTISRDGATIVFEHGMAIWSLDTRTHATAKVAIETRGLPDVPPPLVHTVVSNRLSALRLSPDGKKIAFVARARVFAAAVTGGDAQPVPAESGTAGDLPVWAPDSRRLAYVLDRGDTQAIALYTFPDGPQRVLTPAGHHDDYPLWSPDGTQLAFTRDGRELHLVTVASGDDRIVARGKLDRRPFGDSGDVAFSPAGDWIAYIDSAGDGFANVHVVPTAGGPSHPVSFLPNAQSGSVSWSPDGTRIFFVTSQRTENGEVAQIDLVPRAPHFREDAFRTLFDRAPSPELPAHTIPAPAPSSAPSPSPIAFASPAPKPDAASHAPARRTTIRFDGIRDRLTMLAVGLDVAQAVPTRDGASLILVADAAAEENLYTFSVDETSDDAPVARQLTSTPGRKNDLVLTPDGKSALVLDDGRIVAASLSAPAVHPVAVSAPLDIDFAADKLLVFRQAWSLIDRWFADPHFHGADWNAVRRAYEPFAAGARTPAELRRVISLMLGELNASHSGIGAPPSGPRYTTGRLAVQWDAREYARSGRLRFAEIDPLGPVALAGRVAVGDDLLAVDGVPTAHRDVDALLANRIGVRTELRIAPHGDTAAARTVVVLPVDAQAEGELVYNAWVASRRAYVERISGGRLGYVHLVDMSSASLAKFALDLDVQNRRRDGVVVDVRNNTGGFVDPYAIDILVRRNYLRFVDRFYAAPTERTALGQRSYDRPTVLVTNEHSLSDAENFTEAYRVLHAGTVVGEPTAGWIMFTSSATLADGSTLRLPTTLTIAHDGIDMELHPRPVDITVSDPPGAYARGDDPQLDAAVRELLRRAHR